MYENMKIYNYENIKIYKYCNIQIYMQKNLNVKNAKQCVKKVIIYTKNYKATSNRKVSKETNKQNKENIYKNSKYRNVLKNI